MFIRNYQAQAIETIRRTFSDTNTQFIVMPTGSGKTFTFLNYASEFHSKILIIVPSKELLNQVYESALLFYDKKDISRKGNKFYEDIRQVHICIIHSIRGDYCDYISSNFFDLVIIDEAHHVQSKSYKNFIKKQKTNFPNTKFLGCTATPSRLDGELLEEIMGCCSFEITIPSMIKQKYLCDIEGFGVKTNIDLSDIDDHNGDFSIRQIYQRLCSESRNNMIIDLVTKEMRDRKCLIFCINIQHSKIINDLLNKKGISSRHIDGTYDAQKRKVILDSFKSGEINVLTNCQLLSEGFDEPSIDGIILARPTRSRSLFLQMIGRGLRIYPGKKNCKIIDIVDNHKSTSNFNNIIVDETINYPRINKFKNYDEIKEHVLKEQIKVTETRIEHTNLLDFDTVEDEEATNSMCAYLEDNNIDYYSPITFSEASFLIWYHNLKKEYDGTYKKAKR